MLIPVIAQYLRSHRRLIIPQMGAFIVKEPGQSVLFSELLKRDDGVLRSLLVAAGSSELEAGGEIDRFVFEVRHAIQQGREFPLAGLGVLKPGPNETIAFTYVPQPAEPTAATTDAAATASANTAVASDAPAAGAAVSAEPTTDIPTGKVTAAAVEALYDGNRPAREPEQAPGPSGIGTRIFGTETLGSPTDSAHDAYRRTPLFGPCRLRVAHGTIVPPAIQIAVAAQTHEARRHAGRLLLRPAAAAPGHRTDGPREETLRPLHLDSAGGGTDCAGSHRVRPMVRQIRPRGRRSDSGTHFDRRRLHAVGTLTPAVS